MPVPCHAPSSLWESHGWCATPCAPPICCRRTRNPVCRRRPVASTTEVCSDNGAPSTSQPSENPATQYTQRMVRRGASNGPVTEVAAIEARARLEALNQRAQELSRRAKEQLEALQRAQEQSKKVVKQSHVDLSNSTYYSGAARSVDIRMYQQMETSRNKLSQKLSDANMYINHLEDKLELCNEHLMEATDFLKQVSMEFGTTQRLAESTVAAVQFGADPEDAVKKVLKLSARLGTLEQGVLDHRKEFRKKVVKKVPVAWMGVASQVKLMGDFDQWTRGFDLSAEEAATDSVFSRFQSEVLLCPGTYQVKFLVDGQWRLAGDWPTSHDSMGETVNILVVT